MISINEALQFVLDQTRAGRAVRVPVLSGQSETPDALGRILAEDVTSDIDSPPHDKAMMDGFALHGDNLTGGDGPSSSHVELQVIEEVTAGTVPSKTLASGKASRIMTGAPIPAGASAVVMVERTEFQADPSGESIGTVRISCADLPSAGENILPKATSLAVGQQVLSKGTTLRPIEIGLLSEVGRTGVDVFARPSVAVMTSGDELVTPDKKPGPGQIRNSNNPMLVALARRAGGIVKDLGIARDEEGDIRRLVAEGLTHDILILSGGVSAGVLDLIPKVLADAGVEQIFHKVNLKPGKPMWFGVHESDGRKTLVFGLPGNPVSSLVCFELFARAAIEKLRGAGDVALPMVHARLSQAHQQRGDRPVYFPAAITNGEAASGGLPVATPLPWQGSADLATLAQADCLIYFPAGKNSYTAGDVVEAYRFDD